jgi:hypothetical protein
LPLIDPAVGALEVDEARPIRAVHEDGVLLAEPKVTEVEEGVPQSKGIAAAAGRLGSAVEEVAFHERMDVPIAKVGRRPRFERDAAHASAHVVVPPDLLRDRDRVGHERVGAADGVEVSERGEPYESPQAE